MSTAADWKCGCHQTNPDCEDRCRNCGEERYPKEVEMNKYQVTIQPRGEAPVFYKVGGFDATDALQQGKYQWLCENADKTVGDLESVYATVIEEPLEPIRRAS